MNHAKSIAEVEELLWRYLDRLETPRASTAAGHGAPAAANGDGAATIASALDGAG